MEHYCRTSHIRFNIKFHLVWITRYRKKLTQGFTIAIVDLINASKLRVS